MKKRVNFLKCIVGITKRKLTNEDRCHCTQCINEAMFNLKEEDFQYNIWKNYHKILKPRKPYHYESS